LIVAAGPPSVSPKASSTLFERRLTMLGLAVLFFILAIIAAVLGASGVAGTLANLAWLFVVIFLILAVLSAVVRTAKGKSVA